MQRLLLVTAACLILREGFVLPQTIVIPKEIAKKADVSYSIIIDGVLQIIHLEKQIIVPLDFQVQTYSSFGFLKKYVPTVPTQCYYQGYIDGIPGSQVTLRNCEGLKGLLQFGNISYTIEPLNTSSIFEHVLREIKPDFDDILAYNDNDTNIDMTQMKPLPFFISEKMLQSRKNVHDQNRFLKLYLVVSKEAYEKLGGNEEKVTAEMITLVTYLNTLFIPFRLQIQLVGLEIWTDSNKIPMNSSLEEILDSFLHWREGNLVFRQMHDIAYLIIFRQSGNPPGISTFGRACSPYGGAVVVYSADKNVETFSPIFAHFLAHNLGIKHDNNLVCVCTAPYCIMNTESITAGSRTFSSCSVQDWNNFALTQEANCLFNRAQFSGVLSVPSCGNKIVDFGEDCDCGDDQECNKCCNAATCRLTPGSNCASGKCCKFCKFALRGTECREESNECDLPEYCNGTSQECPFDFYIQNGFPCIQSGAYCYRGKCQSHDVQCQKHFGPKSRSCPLDSYVEINTQADRFGNCGFKDGSYIACAQGDMLCGKLVCLYNDKYPVSSMKGYIIYSKFGDKCISVDYEQTEEVMDPFYVENGASCGVDKICSNRKCVSSKENGTDPACNSTVQCNSRGFCNNRGSCHCIDGWAPPGCSKKGGGGSLNSGPRVTRFIETPDTVQEALLVTFSIIIPIMSVVLIFGLSWKKMRKWCRYNPTLPSSSAD
ncbi:disintegrin and metalloproteinase domain-containing protein 9-like isoform X2 [Ascaphus truei]|uniref:disintegrin and metalloproteinase domain-containing protein 9-like isoform X2 n=1 Tax=Ascaphus truei TaxID=8439 RepID=UPI003F59B2D3